MSQLKKLERDQKFNPDEFNKQFEEADQVNRNEQEDNNQITQTESVTNKQKESNINKQKEDSSNVYIDDLGINMKNLFFEILEKLVNKENPIPYIMETEKRQFTFAIMILIIGGLMMFLSNLMINEEKK